MGTASPTGSDRTALPLTTIFTPPSSCGSSWTYEGSYYNSVSGGFFIQNALDNPVDTDVYPLASMVGAGKACH